MPDAPALIVFLAAAAVLLVTPGPAVIYIVTRSIDQGWRAGLVSTLGIAFGTVFQVLAAALGLSALLLSSALAFNAVKLLGGAYLVYLGLRRLLGREKPATKRTPKLASLRRIFTEGAVVNLLNPKSALFFFAFLPQFVDVSRGNVTGQFLVLGTAFIALGILSDGAYALLAGAVGDRLRRSEGFLSLQRYVTGSIYVLLGLGAAFSGSGRNK